MHLHMGGWVHVCVHACPWVVGGRPAAGLAIQVGIDTYIHTYIHIYNSIYHSYRILALYIYGGVYAWGWQ